MSKVTIKNGDLEIKLNRRALVDIDQTPDGVVFKFQGGGHYYVTAPDMPIETKEKMKQADVSFGSHDLQIDLNNYAHPVYVVANK